MSVFKTYPGVILFFLLFERTGVKNVQVQVQWCESVPHILYSCLGCLSFDQKNFEACNHFIGTMRTGSVNDRRKVV